MLNLFFGHIMLGYLEGCRFVLVFGRVVVSNIWLRLEVCIRPGILWDATQKLYKKDGFLLSFGNKPMSNMKHVG